MKFEMNINIEESDLCSICSCRTGEYPHREPGDPLPDPNDGRLCKRCGVKTVDE